MRDGMYLKHKGACIHKYEGTRAHVYLLPTLTSTVVSQFVQTFPTFYLFVLWLFLHNVPSYQINRKPHKYSKHVEIMCRRIRLPGRYTLAPPLQVKTWFTLFLWWAQERESPQTVWGERGLGVAAYNMEPLAVTQPEFPIQSWWNEYFICKW